MKGASLPLTVIESNLGTFDQESSVERKDVLINLDISTLGVGDENTILERVSDYSQTPCPDATISS